MATGRCLMLATVTAVKDTAVCYPCCCECYSKLFLDTADDSVWCNRCHSSYNKHEVTYRYRLALAVAEGSSLRHVTVFGRTVQPFFGTSATAFNRLMYSTGNQGLMGPYDRSAIIGRVLETTFVGKQFWFGLNKPLVPGSSQGNLTSAVVVSGLTQNGSDVPSRTNLTLVASQMIRAGGEPFTTVMDNLDTLMGDTNGISNQPVSANRFSYTFLEENCDLRLSNSSAFLNLASNTCTLSSSSISGQSCLLSCDREADVRNHLSGAHASYISSHLDNSGVHSLTGANIDVINLSRYKISEMSSFTPVRSRTLAYDSNACKLRKSKSEKVGSTKCDFTLPGDETLPPVGDETLPPNDDELLPPCGDGTLPPYVGDETLPPFEDGASPPGDENTFFLCPENPSPSLGNAVSAVEEWRRSHVSDIEILRNHSENASQQNQSKSFDDSSFLLECDRMGTTLDGLALSCHKEKGTDGSQLEKLYSSSNTDSTAVQLELAEGLLLSKLSELTLTNGATETERRLNTSQSYRAMLTCHPSDIGDKEIPAVSKDHGDKYTEVVFSCDTLKPQSNCDSPKPRFTDSDPCKDILSGDDQLWEHWSGCEDMDYLSKQTDTDVYRASHCDQDSVIPNCKPGSDEGHEGTDTVSSSAVQLDAACGPNVDRLADLAIEHEDHDEGPKAVSSTKTDLAQVTGGSGSSDVSESRVLEDTSKPAVNIVRNSSSTGYRQNIVINKEISLSKNDAGDSLWEELPESEDLEAFLGDFMPPSTSDKSCSRAENERNTQQKGTSDCVGESGTTSKMYRNNLNRCQSPEVRNQTSEGYPPTHNLRSNPLDHCPPRQSTTRQQMPNKSTPCQVKALVHPNTESNISTKVTDALVIPRCSENFPELRSQNLSDVNKSVDLFDSFLSEVGDVKQDLGPARVRCCSQSDDSTHVIMESQIPSSCTVSNQNVSSFLMPEPCTDKQKSVKFSKRLSAVSNVQMMDIRMKVSPHPVNRSTRTPRSCLKPQSLMSKVRSELTSSVKKDHMEDKHDTNVRVEGDVLAGSEELFTPSPITIRQRQLSALKQLHVDCVSKTAPNRTPAFTQSTPLLFSQCPGSRRKSTDVCLKTPLSVLRGQLPDVNISVDLFASPDLFSESTGRDSSLHHKVHRADLKPALTSNVGSPFVYHPVLTNRTKPVTLGSGSGYASASRGLEDTSEPNVGRREGRENFEKSTNGDSLCPSVCVSVNISTCSADLFSPDILGSSLPPQEPKLSLRKNLFF